MRAIVKQGTGGFYLDGAYADPPATAEQATRRWQRFGHKAAVLLQLLDEQYQLCCYCEVRSDLVGLGYHIEHVKPKRLHPHLTFDYKNLAASALDSATDLQAFKAQAHEVFAGHAKLSEFDENQFVSCHQADCSRHFAYLSDGRVVPAATLDGVDTARATYTIDLLNLNSPYLVTLRQRWWEELDDLFTEHDTKGWSLEHLIAVDLVPANGALSPFFSLTRQFFGHVAEEVLRRHAPQLV